MSDEEPTTTEAPPAAEAPAVALPDLEAFYAAPARFGHTPVADTPRGWDVLGYTPQDNAEDFR